MVKVDLPVTLNCRYLHIFIPFLYHSEIKQKILHNVSIIIKDDSFG